MKPLEALHIQRGFIHTFGLFSTDMGVLHTNPLYRGGFTKPLRPLHIQEVLLGNFATGLCEASSGFIPGLNFGALIQSFAMGVLLQGFVKPLGALIQWFAMGALLQGFMKPLGLHYRSFTNRLQ